MRPTLTMVESETNPKNHHSPNNDQRKQSIMALDTIAEERPQTKMVVGALEWYYSLLQNSVDSFRTLCSKFIAQFVDSKSMATISASLHHVAQGRNEPLKQIMSRFTKACLNIPNLHLAVTMHAFIVKLRPDLFLNTLYAGPPSNTEAPSVPVGVKRK